MKTIVIPNKLHGDLSIYLEKQKNGGSRYQPLIDKVENKLGRIGKEINDIKVICENTADSIDRYMKNKEKIRQLKNNKDVKLAEESMIDICDEFYENLLIQLLKIPEQNSNVTIFNEVANRNKIETTMSIKLLMEKFNLDINNLIEEIINMCWIKYDEYIEQTTNIFLYATNGNRHRLLTNHINMLNELAVVHIQKEFWKLAKNKKL